MNDQRIDVVWPNEKLIGIRSGWRKNWVPKEGMVGYVVGCLSPNHAVSNENQTILLVKIDDQCVPITEKGIKEYRQFPPSSGSVSITAPTASAPSLPPKNQTDDEEQRSKDDEQVTV